MTKVSFVIDSISMISLKNTKIFRLGNKLSD